MQTRHFISTCPVRSTRLNDIGEASGDTYDIARHHCTETSVSSTYAQSAARDAQKTALLGMLRKTPSSIERGVRR
jgi:hypothetical protein